MTNHETAVPTETDRLHAEILEGRAQIRELRDLLRTENQRANAAIDRETTAEQAALEAQQERDRLRAVVERVRRLHDALDAETDLTSPDHEITRGAAARKIAAALDGWSPPAAVSVPPPAPRAEDLRWAADRLVEEIQRGARFSHEDARHPGLCESVMLLRRWADEATPVAAPRADDRAAVAAPVKQRADLTELEWAEQERARFERLYTRETVRVDKAEARAAAMEHAMESTAADALKHRGCHRDLMAQCLRAERAEAEVERLRRLADEAQQPEPEAEPTAEEIARANVLALHQIGEQLAGIESWMWGHLANVREAAKAQSAVSGPVAGEQQNETPEAEAHPAEHSWAAELHDPLADEWVPGTRYTVRDRAVNALTHSRRLGPTWKDGSPTERRLVRATTTYTVEPDPEPAVEAPE